jgi:CTD small phosphatase-like protein 2
VDNAPYSYLYQLDNAIPILPYYWGDDNQLLQLEKYLEEVNRSQDVREVNRRYFQLHRYVEFEEAEEAARQLYFFHQ